MRQEWSDDRLDLLDAKVEDGFGRMDAEFARVDQRFEQVDERFAQVDERFDQVDRRFVEVEHRLDLVDERFRQVDQRLGRVEKGIEFLGDKIDSRFDALNRTVVHACVGMGTMLAAVVAAVIGVSLA